MPQPLSGLLVLDFTTLLPGPLATLMLAEAGAEVIKVERPGGEEMRFRPPYWDGEAAVFALLNRGKTTLALDLKRDADCARLAPILARADILVEQFRPGVMQRLGLAYAAVRAVSIKDGDTVVVPFGWSDFGTSVALLDLAGLLDCLLRP